MFNAVPGLGQRDKPGAPLLDMGCTGRSPTQHEALARVERAQRHLLALINDVLNFTRLDAARVEYELRPTELGAVIGTSAR